MDSLIVPIFYDFVDEEKEMKSSSEMWYETTTIGWDWPENV